MNDNRGSDYPERNRGSYEPRRFKSLVAELHRETQQHRSTQDDQRPHEARLVRVTRWLVVATVALVVVGVLGFGAALLQWAAMREQLVVFRDSIIVDQRPWIGLEKLEIAGPLTHDDTGWTGGMRWHVLVKYKLRNYGKTPAAHVNFWGHLLPDVPHFQVYGKWHGSFVGDDTRGACDYTQFATKYGIDNGSLIFPGVTWNEKFFDVVGIEDRFNDIRQYYTEGEVSVFSMPLCVTYTSVYTNFDLATQLAGKPSTNTSVFGAAQYFTALGYRIGKQSRLPFDLNGETVKQADIALGEPGFQANYVK